MAIHSLGKRLRASARRLAAARTALLAPDAAADPGAPPDTGLPAELGPETAKYLGEVAAESFKRQAELDEAVWRSLPFFAATLALAATVIAAAARDVPPFTWSTMSVLLNGLLVLATISFGWALRWFWTVVRPREYEYPSDDSAIRRYAEEITVFHAGQDDLALRELRLFMAEQYGTAARTNFRHNVVKMKARSRVLLFMMVGFVLAFACEASIFVRRGMCRPNGAGAQQHVLPRAICSADPGSRQAGPAGTAPPAAGPGGGAVLGAERQARHSGQALMAQGPKKPPSPSGTQRPVPPAMQVMAKFSRVETARTAKRAAPPPPPAKPEKK